MKENPYSELVWLGKKYENKCPFCKGVGCSVCKYTGIKKSEHLEHFHVPHHFHPPHNIHPPHLDLSNNSGSSGSGAGLVAMIGASSWSMGNSRSNRGSIFGLLSYQRLIIQKNTMTFITYFQKLYFIYECK